MTPAPDITALPQWVSLRAWLDQQRANADGLGQFVRRQAAELDALRRLMAEREGELAAWERGLETEQAAFAQQWQQLETMRRTAESGAHHVRHEARRLEQLRAALEAEREAVAAAAADRQTGDESQASYERLARVTEERNALARELAEARAQITSLARATLELADSRKESGQLRVQIAKLQSRLAHAQGHAGQNNREQVRALEEQRDRLVEQFALAERQSQDSQRQLELERREAGRERVAWTEELARLRTALETQSQVMATRGRALDESQLDPGEAKLMDIIGQLEHMQQEMARCATASGVSQDAEQAV